jgi:transposase-like protein
VFLDGIVTKRSGAGGARNVSLLVASAATSEGSRAIPGICAGASQDRPGWPAFLRHLVDRGQSGVERIIPDPGREHRGIPPRRPAAALHGSFYRNVFGHVASTKVRKVSHMPKAIHARESQEAAQEKAATVLSDLRRQKPGKAADLVATHIEATHIDASLNHYSLPDSHRIKIRTGKPLKRIMKEIRRSIRLGDISGRPELPEPGSSQVAPDRGQPMVDPRIHEPGPVLRGADIYPRSRRLKKYA